MAVMSFDAPSPGSDNFDPKRFLWDGKTWWSLDKQWRWNGYQWRSPNDPEPSPEATPTPQPITAEMRTKRAKRRALAAAGFGVVALVSNVPAISDALAYPSATTLGYSTVVAYWESAVVAIIGVVVVSVLAIGFLAVPALTGRGARYQKALATVSAMVFGALTLLGLMSLAFSDLPPAHANWTWLGIAAGGISAAFAFATVIAAAPGRSGRVHTI
jgi:hypothetical protein